jgi:hypothetical protein
MQLIDEFNIQSRIGYFIINNATNNGAEVDAVVAYYFPYIIPKQYVSQCLCCLSHIINLAAKAFLYSVRVKPLL